MGPPQAPQAKWVLEGPAQAFDSLGWRVPTVARQACSTHKKTKRNKSLELFIFSLPKAMHFLSFLGTLTKISLTSSALKEWKGSVGWSVKAYF
jgi:hypothetical protein